MLLAGASASVASAADVARAFARRALVAAVVVEVPSGSLGVAPPTAWISWIRPLLAAPAVRVRGSAAAGSSRLREDPATIGPGPVAEIPSSPTTTSIPRGAHRLFLRLRRGERRTLPTRPPRPSRRGSSPGSTGRDIPSAAASTAAIPQAITVKRQQRPQHQQQPRPLHRLRQDRRHRQGFLVAPVAVVGDHPPATWRVALRVSTLAVPPLSPTAMLMLEAIKSLRLRRLRRRDCSIEEGQSIYHLRGGLLRRCPNRQRPPLRSIRPTKRKESTLKDSTIPI
mmetsp:Transcript_9658/g.20478  ORF Transcript_9658/g.20478 Transcript_9658/m.20478 type:complete len:282 (+) Transcript_9658:894-1739(+)